jgi:RNA polymerase sigma-70 factor, ECF subfamily
MTQPMRSSHAFRAEPARPGATGELPIPPATPPAAAVRAGPPPAGAGPQAAAGAMPLPRPPHHAPRGPATTVLRPVPDHPPSPPPPPPVANSAVAAQAAPEASDDTGAWTLVKAAQAGDMRAFSELFDRYYDVVFRYVLFRMGDRTLAEDITQETFLRALRRITSVTYQGRDIGAWFVTIARNLIFDHVKSSRYRLESTTSEIVELSPSTHGPEQQVLDLATNEELLRCVKKLNPDQQECIQLRFLQGLSVAETAKIMDRNEGAVKALQHRAVRRLAQLLPEGLR